MKQRVIVIGGGVGGLTAAHELAERDFDVTVFESRDILGGKARSFTKASSELPAEHGFRFVPGFYRHLPDTMARIPYPGNPCGVADNLVDVPLTQTSNVSGAPLVLPTRVASMSDLKVLARALLHPTARMPIGDAAHFAHLLFVLLCSCEERRFAEYEHTGWWDFTGASSPGRSNAYRQYLVEGLTRSLVAARAKEMSTRTCGSILLQLLLDMARIRRSAARVLNGPTNEAWIDPWIAHLRRLGVTVRVGQTVEQIGFDGHQVTHVDVRRNGILSRETADWYVAAVPAPIMHRLTTPSMRAADPKLGGIDRLRTRSMNGIQFYLRLDVPVIRGLTIYSNTPWSLTSVSQAQFWTAARVAHMREQGVGGILSVDVSDWETKGMCGKRADECDAQEIHAEVWHQLQAWLNRDGVTVLEDNNLVSWSLDTDIRWPGSGPSVNLEPMLINTVGSWNLRPEAVTRIVNLVLAADYVQTSTDLACMEGANEAARRAVNGILMRAAPSARRCRLWRLREPVLFAPLRELDRHRWRAKHYRRPTHSPATPSEEQ